MCRCRALRLKLAVLVSEHWQVHVAPDMFAQELLGIQTPPSACLCPKVSYVALSASGKQLHVSGKISGEQSIYFLMSHYQINSMVSPIVRKEKKRKDYAFRRQFNEKPSIIPGCPGPIVTSTWRQGQLSTESVLLGTTHLVHFAEAALA